MISDSNKMSDTSVKNSKTECVIAIDDEDTNDDSDGDAIKTRSVGDTQLFTRFY